MAELRGIHYRVGTASILMDVSLRFRPNRFNVILGPNGAGKSTLLRIATGLLAPSAGEAFYEDRPVTDFDAAALARKRAVLSQRVELVFPMPTEDVVMMGRYPHYGRAPSSLDRSIVRRALELVGMEAKRSQPYPTLSGGEQQKVQLARVLAQIWNREGEQEQKFLFLDEPISGLDVHYQIHILETVRSLLDRGCTVVAILHDLNTAFEYGDSFFVLDQGRLVQQADRAEDIGSDLIEAVFKVRARRLTDGDSQGGFWRFHL